MKFLKLLNLHRYRKKQTKAGREKIRGKVAAITIGTALLLSSVNPEAYVFATGSGAEQGAAAGTAATTAIPTIVAESAVLIDAKTGTVLYDKNMNARYEPASTTKMITGLMALERLDLNKVVTIDAKTPFTEGSRIYLTEGENITVEQLLYALFLESANDSAVALALNMAPTVEDFAQMMNYKAKEMGAQNTTFVNPNGLHQEGHLSTAYDLAMIAKEAMKNKTFRKLVTTYKYHIPATNKQDERFLYNTNRLLYDEKHKTSANGVIRPCKYEGVTGIKTGYTSHAGGCLVSGAERDGTELIAVVLKSTDMGRFGDSIALLDWGFANYKTVKMVGKNTSFGQIGVAGGNKKSVNIVTKEACYCTVSKDKDLSNVSAVGKTRMIEAPIEKGTLVGQVDYFNEKELICSVDLVAAETVEKWNISSFLSAGSSVDIVKNTGIAFVSIAAVGSIALFIVRQINLRKRRKIRMERIKRLAMERAEAEKAINSVYSKRDLYMKR